MAPDARRTARKVVTPSASLLRHPQGCNASRTPVTPTLKALANLATDIGFPSKKATEYRHLKTASGTRKRVMRAMMVEKNACRMRLRRMRALVLYSQKTRGLSEVSAFKEECPGIVWRIVDENG